MTKTRIWLISVALLLGFASVIAAGELTPASRISLHVVRIGAMSVERAGHQATLLKTGQVLITGGCAGRGCDRILASVEIYDPATQTFKVVAPMSTPRASHTATLLPNGRVMVCGGWTGSNATSSAEIYDPAKDQWTAAGNMTQARVSQIAVPVQDGRVLIMGGGTGRLGNLASAEIFDSSTGTFSAVGRMRTNHYLATALADGRVLVSGGQDSQGRILRTAEIFNPKTNTFKPTGDMIVPRVKHAAALLPDGKVLIIGGSDARGYQARFRSTEIYDPSMGRFSAGQEMHWGRHKIRDAVAVVPSGAVLVAGGAVHPELFDPTQRKFIPVQGELSGPQMFATATPLPDGDVLVLGGYDEHTQASASAWLVRLGR